jgi:HK97 gp10 family phage protein
VADAFRITVNKMPKVKARVEAEGARAVSAALKVGEEEAKRILIPGHGVDTGEMEAGITTRKTGEKSGELVNPTFYGLFLEYGTVHMDPIPHMRPAARKMGKELRKLVKENLGQIR